jgi:hypothetical protein
MNEYEVNQIYKNRKTKYESLLLNDDTKVFENYGSFSKNVLEDVYNKVNSTSKEDDIFVNNKKVLIMLYIDNSNNFVEKDINAIFTQTHVNITLLVILDNCNEDIVKRVMQYRRSTNNNMIIYKARNNNEGREGAINQAFDLIIQAKYEYDYALMIKSNIILDKNVVKNSIRFLANNINYGVMCNNSSILKLQKRNILWHLQNIEYSSQDRVVENIEFVMYRKKVIDKIYERGYIYNSAFSKNADYELSLEAQKNNYKIKIDSTKIYSKVETSLKTLFINKIKILNENISALRKHKYKYASKDFNKHILFILTFILQLFLIVNSAIVGKVPLLFAVSIILVLSLLDSLFSIRKIQHKNKVTYFILITLILPLLYFYFNIFVLICGYFYNLKNQIK